MAILEYLKYAQQRGRSNCTISTDFKRAVQEIQDPGTVDTRLTTLVLECREYIRYTKRSTLPFEGRAMNKVADTMTRAARQANFCNLMPT